MIIAKKRVLVVGQVPPPYGGQAIMIEQFLQGKYSGLELFHVEMSFSKDMNDMGKFQFNKVLHLFKVILSVYYYRFRYGIRTLYYPPSGPLRVPFYRDVIILTFIRPLFSKVCFHFHAAGISELYPTLGGVGKFFFRWAYFNADLGIRLSVSSPADCTGLKAKKESIIPYGIKDYFGEPTPDRHQNRVVKILFVGVLSESKGLMVLLQACKVLKERNIGFGVDAMGKFESLEFENLARKFVAETGMEDSVNFPGVQVGAAKFNFFRQADIFCFPSHFEAESFPVVLLEASCFGLPIVSTEWRGIPSIVEDEKNGFLTRIKDHSSVADKLGSLINDSGLRTRMGQEARRMYLEKYSLEKFYERMEEAIKGL